MQHSFSKNSRGFGHLGIIVAVVVVLAVGAAGWVVWQKNHKPLSTADQTIQDAIKNAKCTYDDTDLCKFYTGWKAQKYYTVTSASGNDGQKTTTVMQIEGDKSHLTINGSMAYEVITIGKDTYTKAGDGTWWKQTTTNPTANQYKDTIATDLTDPGDTPGADKTTYKKLGTEKCGDLTCFKYQQTDPSDTKTTTYLWFDDEDYQLRRIQSIGQDSSFDATYSYDKVSVHVPSPVKDLGANQYLIPGQNEPTTLPSTGDSEPTPEELQQFIDQYQQ